MTRFCVLVLVLVFAATVALSAQYYRAFEQITVAGTAIGMTAATISAGAGHPQANWASCRVRTAQLSVRYDGGTPTNLVGTLVEVGDILVFNKYTDMSQFLAIRTGASGQLDCTYGE